VVDAWPFVAGLKQAPDLGVRSENVEKIRRCAQALNTLPCRVVGQARAVRKEPGEARERARAVPVVDEIGDVERRPIAARLV
jgi:hypothetical protein